MRFGIAGAQARRPLRALQRLRRPLQLGQSNGAHVPRLGDVRIERGHGVESGDRLLQPLKFQERRTAIVNRLNIGRLDGESPLIGAHRLFQPLQRFKGDAEVVPRLARVGLKLHSLAITIHRFLRTPEGGEADACAVLSLRPGWAKLGCGLVTVQRFAGAAEGALRLPSAEHQFRRARAERQGRLVFGEGGAGLAPIRLHHADQLMRHASLIGRPVQQEAIGRLRLVETTLGVQRGGGAEKVEVHDGFAEVCIDSLS